MVHHFFQGANLQLSPVETMLSLEKEGIELKSLRLNQIARSSTQPFNRNLSFD